MIKIRYLIIWLALVILVVGFFVFFKDTIANGDTVTTTVKISVCGNEIKENGEHCDNSDLGGKSCTDLGYNSGTLDCSISCEFNTSSCTTNAETTAIPLFSSAIGGTYTLSNNNNTAAIDLPENFYTEDLRLQMFSYDKSVLELSEPAPSGESFIGKIYDFVFINPSGGTISTIDQPATLSLTYTATDVSGIDESTLAPYRRENDSTSWQFISGATVDTINKKVTFTTTSFSSFALFGSPPTPASTPTPTQQSGGGGGGYIYNNRLSEITFQGKTSPNTSVILLKDGQIFSTTIINNDGLFKISAKGLVAGGYIFGIYAIDKQNNRSSFLTFPENLKSGDNLLISNIILLPQPRPLRGDVNRDGKIDLVDFSIAVYWYKRFNPPVSVDLNSDGKVDLTDFSILVFNWTG